MSRKGFFSKLVSSLKSSEAAEPSPEGQFAPGEILPLDEKFVSQFHEGGGHFIYCANEQDALAGLEQYAKEHNWPGLYISDENLRKFENTLGLNITFNNDGQMPAVVSGCEALIAFNGGIMVHNHHTGGRRLSDLPEHHVIIAYTSQIVANLRDGMTSINLKYRDNRPGNIAVIRAPHDQNVQMASADPNKDRNVFLVLIEDEI
jgi:L-lactate dehydrogenase complex protein LldG